MVRTPSELRSEAQIYSNASHLETDPPTKRRLAGHAFALAQLAERVDRERLVIDANIRHYERMLGSALDDGRRKQADALLNEEHAKLAALRPNGRPSDVTERLLRLLEEAIAVGGADMANVQIIDPMTGCLRIAASHGFETPFLEFFAVVPDGDHSACGAALKQGDRIIVPDVEQSPLFIARRSGEVMRNAGVRSVQSTPLVGRSGNLVGMVSTHWRRTLLPTDIAPERLDGLVQRIVGHVESAARTPLELPR